MLKSRKGGKCIQKVLKDAGDGSPMGLPGQQEEQRRWGWGAWSLLVYSIAHQTPGCSSCSLCTGSYIGIVHIHGMSDYRSVGPEPVLLSAPATPPAGTNTSPAPYPHTVRSENVAMATVC